MALNRIPIDVSALPFTPCNGMLVTSFRPHNEDQGREVHLLINYPGAIHPLLVQFTSKEMLDNFIEILKTHRAGVWPTP